MRARLLAVLLLAAPTFAGCLQLSGEEPASTAEAAALLPSAGNAAWTTMTVRATPEGGLAGFWWTVPEAAVVEDDLYQGQKTVALEVAMLGTPEERERVAEWALMSFVELDGTLFSLGDVVSAPMRVRPHEATGPGPEEAQPSSHDPFFLRLGLDVLGPNDTVGFVLAARSAQPMDVQVAFRALPEAPALEDEPVGSAEDFLAQREGPALPLAPRGVGSGLQVALFAELTGLHPLIARGFEMWTDAVVQEGSVDLDARPAAARRAQSFSASFGAPEGYASAMGVYLAQASAGSWSAEVDLRGEALSVGGPVVPGPLSSLGAAVTGFPAFFAVGDGPGASASRLRLETTAVDVGGFEMVVFSQVDLGATLTTLLGSKGDTGVAGYGGPLGEGGGAFVTLHDGHLLTHAPGAPVRMLLGALPRA